MATASFDRLQMVLNQGEIVKVKAPITLLRPKETPPFLVIEENYGLDKFTDGPVTVHLLEGNHVSIIENKDCANIINRIISEQDSDKGSRVVTDMVEKQRSIQI